MKCLRLGMTALILWAVVVESQTDETTPNYGAGASSCGKWLADTRDPESPIHLHMRSWVLGWVSAAGYYGGGRLRQTDPDAISAWIDNYCGSHPLDTVAVAAGALVKALNKKS